MITLPWHQALAFALSGQNLPLAEGAAPDFEGLASELACHGFDSAALRAHRDEVWAAGRPWPHPVPSEQRGAIGAAQFYAVLAELRHAWQLDAQKPARPAPRRPLTADDRRLLADVPPHHVLH